MRRRRGGGGAGGGGCGAVVLTLLVVATGGVLRNRRAIAAYVRLHYDERACRTFVAPPGHVALEFDPAKAPTLAANGGGDYRQDGDKSPALFVPRALARYLGGTATRVYGGIAFMGERTSPGGTRRLVIVDVGGVGMVTSDPARDGGRCAEIVIGAHSLPVLGWRDVATPPATRSTSVGIILSREFDPASPRGNVVIVHMATGFYSGRPDPADASKFTIEYWTGGQQDFIDGRLLESGVVVLAPRDDRDGGPHDLG